MLVFGYERDKLRDSEGRTLLVGVKSNTYYVIWVYVCILSYTAHKKHAPYCHLWPARL